MKCKSVIALFLSVCGFCLVLFSACSMCSKFFRNIEELHYVYWVDRKAGIVLRQAVNYGVGYGTIENDEGEHPISFHFEDSYDYFYDSVIVITEQSEPDLPSEEYLIAVKAADLNNFNQIRSIQRTTLFGWEYGQIVLEKQEMQETDFDAMDFVTNTSWTDENHELSFSMNMGDYDGAYSLAFYVQTEYGKQQVSFVWRPNNRFEIQQWETKEVLAEGTYESCGLNAVLHFERDELWGRKGDLTLKGTLDFLPNNA